MDNIHNLLEQVPSSTREAHMLLLGVHVSHPWRVLHCIQATRRASSGMLSPPYSGRNTLIQHSTFVNICLNLKLQVLHVGHVRKYMAFIASKRSDNVAFSRVQARTSADAAEVSLLVCEQMQSRRSRICAPHHSHHCLDEWNTSDSKTLSEVIKTVRLLKLFDVYGL